MRVFVEGTTEKGPLYKGSGAIVNPELSKSLAGGKDQLQYIHTPLGIIMISLTKFQAMYLEETFNDLS